MLAKEFIQKLTEKSFTVSDWYYRENISNKINKSDKKSLKKNFFYLFLEEKNELIAMTPSKT